MSRYIDYDAIDYRNDRLHDKSEEFLNGVIYMAQRIEEAPSIDIEPKRGEWIWDKDGMDWNIGAWCCSECGSRNANIGCNGNENPMWWSGSRFCPNCGADMRGREGE